MPRTLTHTFLAAAAALVLTLGPSVPSAQEEEPGAPEGESAPPAGAEEGGPVAMPSADEPAAGPADLGITFGIGNAPTHEEEKILESLQEDYEIYLQTANEFKRVIANIIKVEYGKRKIQIEKEFGEQIRAGNPQYALWAFAVFYVICLILNWWFYLGPKAEIKNP